MKRRAQLVHVKPEAVPEYERLHAAVWHEVLATLQKCNIRNYTAVEPTFALLEAQWIAELAQPGPTTKGRSQVACRHA